jgi:hypothetical protein
MTVGIGSERRGARCINRACEAQQIVMRTGVAIFAAHHMMNVI